MKKIVLSLGILLSISATLFAQEKKTLNISGTQNDVWVWDVITPVYTTEGDSVTYVTILTLREIEKIAFSVEWQCKNGETIKFSEKELIRHGSVPWTNDRPDVFNAIGLWYNIYVLPVPRLKAEVETTRFAGNFCYAKNRVNMGQSVVPINNQLINKKN